MSRCVQTFNWYCVSCMIDIHGHITLHENDQICALCIYINLSNTCRPVNKMHDIFFPRQTLTHIYINTYIQYCSTFTIYPLRQLNTVAVFSSLFSCLTTKVDNLPGLKSLPDDSSLTLKDKFNQMPAYVFTIDVILMNCFLGGEVSDREMFMWERRVAIFQMDEGFHDKRVETGEKRLTALTGED